MMLISSAGQYAAGTGWFCWPRILHISLVLYIVGIGVIISIHVQFLVGLSEIKLTQNIVLLHTYYINTT